MTSFKFRNNEFEVGDLVEANSLLKHDCSNIGIVTAVKIEHWLMLSVYWQIPKEDELGKVKQEEYLPSFMFRRVG